MVGAPIAEFGVYTRGGRIDSFICGHDTSIHLPSIGLIVTQHHDGFVDHVSSHRICARKYHP